MPRSSLLLPLLVACAPADGGDGSQASTATITGASASATATSGASGATTGSTAADASGSSSVGGSSGSSAASIGEVTGGTDGTDGTSGGETPPPYACPAGLEPCPAFPAASWESRDPAELGLDADLLAEFAAATAGGRGCVVRYGYLAGCWGDPGGEFEWASASKPVWSTFLLFAVAEGKIAGVDAPLTDFAWPLAPADQGMTLHHLANQVSGYALPEPPGAAWGYNDYAIKLYAQTLFERIFDDGDADQIAAAPGRLGPLGFEDGPFFGLVKGAPRVMTTPRDFARFGWLWANHGVWDQAPLIPAELVALALTPGVSEALPRTVGAPVDDYLGIGSAGGGADQTPLGPGAYAFNWWLNPGQVTWPSAPADTIQANGHWNGEVLTVIPSLGLVAAWKGQGADPASFSAAMDPLLALLVAAAG